MNRVSPHLQRYWYLKSTFVKQDELSTALYTQHIFFALGHDLLLKVLTGQENDPLPCCLSDGTGGKEQLNKATYGIQ